MPGALLCTASVAIGASECQPQIQNAFQHRFGKGTCIAMTDDIMNFEELPLEEQALQVMKMYKLALDLTHHRSLWYRLFALAGHRDARRGQLAFAAGEKAAVTIINSSPRFQAVWRRLCDEEPHHSPVKPFLPRVCAPPAFRSPNFQRNNNNGDEMRPGRSAINARI